MGMRPAAAVLGLITLLCCTLSYAGPVLTLPPATTAPPVVAAPAAPAPSSAPTAPALGTAAGAAMAAPVAPPPPARFGARHYSFLDLVGFQEQPYGREDIGHGARLAASYALSANAFLLAAAARRNRALIVTRRYDFGAGINSAGADGHSVFAAVLWNDVSVTPDSGPRRSGRGYAVELGVRAMALPKVELFATGRYDNNPALPGHGAGEMGFFYQALPTIAIGLDLSVDSEENDYLITLRWYY